MFHSSFTCTCTYIIRIFPVQCKQVGTLHSVDKTFKITVYIDLSNANLAILFILSFTNVFIISIYSIVYV